MVGNIQGSPQVERGVSRHLLFRGRSRQIQSKADRRTTSAEVRLGAVMAREETDLVVWPPDFVTPKSGPRSSRSA